jgi:hypothetical protein
LSVKINIPKDLEAGRLRSFGGLLLREKALTQSSRRKARSFATAVCCFFFFGADSIVVNEAVMIGQVFAAD